MANKSMSRGCLGQLNSPLLQDKSLFVVRASWLPMPLAMIYKLPCTLNHSYHNPFRVNELSAPCITRRWQLSEHTFVHYLDPITLSLSIIDGLGVAFWRKYFTTKRSKSAWYVWFLRTPNELVFLVCDQGPFNSSWPHAFARIMARERRAAHGPNSRDCWSPGEPARVQPRFPQDIWTLSCSVIRLALIGAGVLARIWSISNN